MPTLDTLAARIAGHPGMVPMGGTTFEYRGVASVYVVQGTKTGDFHVRFDERRSVVRPFPTTEAAFAYIVKRCLTIDRRLARIARIETLTREAAEQYAAELARQVTAQGLPTPDESGEVIVPWVPVHPTSGAYRLKTFLLAGKATVHMELGTRLFYLDLLQALEVLRIATRNTTKET